MTSSIRQVDFCDSVQQRLLFKARGVGMCAYAIALAAFQRGLRVVFHYEYHSKTSFFARNRVQGCHGEMFSVSDGCRTHYFNRSQGDLTPSEASAISGHKQKTKSLLSRNGVPVADGILVNRGEHKKVDAFLQRHPGKRFVIKPVAGSLGIDVHLRLVRDQVLAMLEQAREQPFLLEEHVVGDEYRCYVVDGRCVFAGQRMAARVIGDGKHSVAQLIALKNKVREAHPYYYNMLIKANQDMMTLLDEQGLTTQSVPVAGQVVLLSTIDSVHPGGEIRNVTETLPAWVIEIAEAAQRALGLPFCGVDLIVERSHEAEKPRAIVLETNSRAHLQQSLLSPQFLNWGNAVAEAIIDFYFPATKAAKRFTKATFDFSAVLQALKSGCVAEVGLPVLSDDWVHQRTRLPSNALVAEIRARMLALGIHGGVYQLPDGSSWLDVLASRSKCKQFIDGLSSP